MLRHVFRDLRAKSWHKNRTSLQERRALRREGLLEPNDVTQLTGALPHAKDHDFQGRWAASA